ncbi:MAG: MerR family transcriptional regulator [Desulfobacteraceae bacterium]|jgi:DNA-binding transcriptional MerR regulator|nr:MAG: MerR family transcriptional regulator [Desulfobacteraceae bacterium]
MKIGELVQKTNVPKETIHYYVREGVLRRPRKKGKNLADYSDDYVEQIRIIRTLQKNYFLPLSVIKKILKRHKRQSLSEKSSFELLSGYFKPVDRLLAGEVTGKEAFQEVTGLSAKWQSMMEQWGVISSETREGRPVYSQDDVIIGRLLVDMDRLGFGPKDGYNPEDLKEIADFIRDYVIRTQKDYYQSSLERLSSEDLVSRGGNFTEVMSLFFYHLYRKVVKEEYRRLVRSLNDSASQP